MILKDQERKGQSLTVLPAQRLLKHGQYTDRKPVDLSSAPGKRASIQMPHLAPQSPLTHHRPLNFEICLRYDQRIFLGGLYE